MTFRMYVAFMSAGTILSWIAWLIVVWTTDPFETGIGGFVIFYVTLGMSLVGSLTLLGTLYRVGFLKRDIVSREVRTSFRHAVALSLVAMLSLALSAQGRFRWWHVLVLILVMTVIEYFFLMKEESRRI